ERTSARDRRPAALVLVPTRELAQQVSNDVAALGSSKGVSVAAVYGGVPLPPQAKRARGAHVVVATPGRLQDLLDRRLLDLGAGPCRPPGAPDPSLFPAGRARRLEVASRPGVDGMGRRLPRHRQTLFSAAPLDGVFKERARRYTTAPSRFEAGIPTGHENGAI